jgi:hypothetical protein
MRKLGLPQLIDATRSPDRELSLAMVAARILDPQSKLATARELDSETATTSLLETLQLESATADDLYEAMDWLFVRQSRIEERLAKRHLSNGHARALRRDFDVFRRPELSFGAFRAFAR